MKKTVLAVILIPCILGFSELAKAEGIKPVDFYLSAFGGYAFPLKTDLSSGGITVLDSELDNSPSFGGKVGMWFTAPRKTLGIDVGAEIDVTNFYPDQKAGQVLMTNVGIPVVTNAVDLNATYFGIHVLARLPMGVTSELPNGRWFPYIGVGGGGQRLSFQPAGATEGRETAPAFQGLGGVKVFLSKHIAVFGEGKFTRAEHTLEFQGGGSVDLTVQAAHGVGGVSFHF
jgi:hypothetical protein